MFGVWRMKCPYNGKTGRMLIERREVDVR
jgi:hypothetical protein